MIEIEYIFIKAIDRPVYIELTRRLKNEVLRRKDVVSVQILTLKEIKYNSNYDLEVIIQITLKDSNRGNLDKDNLDFINERMNEPWSHPFSKYFYNLVKIYNNTCESYDQTVCSGRMRGIAIPCNTVERGFINNHAKKLRQNLIAEACNELDINSDKAKELWQEAMRNI